MELRLDHKKIKNPTPEQIKSELAVIGTPNNLFAVLISDDGNFIQTTGEVDKGFVLEFIQKGQTTKYLQVNNKQLSLSQIVDAFISYLTNSSIDSIVLEWEEVDENKDLKSRDNVILWILLIASWALIYSEINYKGKFDFVAPILSVCWIVYALKYGKKVWYRLGERKNELNPTYGKSVMIGVLSFVMMIVISLVWVFKNAP